jgi:outer membrane protein
VRVARGWNAEASLLDIVPGGDLSLSPERTGVFNVEVGKLLDERFNGWPVDIWVKGSYTRYLEQGLQPDFNGYQLYIKGFYYLPWSKWVKTRFGLGEGLSWAEEIPYLEAQSIESKNPNTSRLLNYLDVSIDVSIGDLIRWNKLKDTYLGFVVIHRSGVFGWSDIFGGVDGGSNYNSVYIETVF